MLRRLTSIPLFFNSTPILKTSSLMLYTPTNHHFLKGINSPPIHNPFLSFNTGITSLQTSSASSNGRSRINHNLPTGFNLKPCYNKTKDRTFTPTDLGLVAIGPNEEDAHTRLANGRAACQPLRLPEQEKIVVAVDVDEVLGNFVSALNRFIADRYSSNHSVSEYHVYEFFKIWNCSRDEADFRVHEFFKTPYFKKDIHPLPGAQEALHRLSRFCNLSVVTSRQNAIKDQTIEWIDKHFPRLFQEIYFGNHFALDGESRPKSEICKSFNAKILIDDNPRYALDCAEAGIRVLLFDYENSYPWCKTDSIDQHPLVTKVYNWEEVEQQMASWIV